MRFGNFRSPRVICLALSHKGGIYIYQIYFEGRLVGPETWLSLITFVVGSTISKVSVACFEHLGDDM